MKVAMSDNVVELRPAVERRIGNYSGDEHCSRCLDDGGFLVTISAADAMVPCPFCERGFRAEFGLGKKKEGDEYVEYESPHGGPWGRDGYWSGARQRKLLRSWGGSS
jgi:hypothetical protein